jgi:hypothetical protein
MQLTNISISAVKFNNLPFFRELTAVAMTTVNTLTAPASGNSLIAWSFPINKGIYARTPNGTPYQSATLDAVSAIGTMYFSFSASQYDYKTTRYTLCAHTFQCINYDVEDGQTSFYTVSFDTFPNIDFTLFLNNQTSETDTLFYRLTSSTPFDVKIKLQSLTYSLSTSLSSNYHRAWYTLNNSSTLNNTFSATNSFTRSTPRLSSVQAYLSATSGPNNITFADWYSPHILSKEIKASFIPNYPVADFIAWAKYYFASPQERYEIDTSSITNLSTQSQGLSFYGEGHTEEIILSTASIPNHNYNWIINNPPIENTVNVYPYFGSSDFSVAVAPISTIRGLYPSLPISLLVSNSYILSSGPSYYYDDTTGVKTYYPFYTSTITPFGSANSNNFKLRQNIEVLPFGLNTVSNFIPGIPSIVYLPINGLDVEFTAFSDLAIYNPKELSACYDRHGYIWKWSTFDECSGTDFTSNLPTPSSWGTVECSGTFPKKWRFEPETLTYATLVTGVAPVQTLLYSTTWYLTAYTAQKIIDTEPKIIYLLPQDARSSYTFSLQYSGYGGDLVDIPGFTVSRFGNTFVTVGVQHKIQNFINITQGVSAGDWPVIETSIDYAQQSTVIPPYEINIYTPNKYVLTNTPITLQNLFARTVGAVSAIELELDDVAGETVILTGDDIGKDITITYSTPGIKNIKIAGYNVLNGVKNTYNFPSLLYVVEKYDTVDPDSYYSIDKILLDLPWKNQPQIGANDWVVSDNFNSCIKQFYDNLTYLTKRNNVYQDTYNEYYGWLGSEPTVIQGVTACPLWTWEDLDCTSPDNQYVTWSELMLGGVIPEVTETGSLFNCGRWEQQTCTLSSLVPSCLGKYCLEWKWSARKSENTTALITWKDTKTGGKYQKEWRQPLEDCDIATTAKCDEGVWNVNIPGLDFYYDPIPECYSQNRCNYTAIASHNNIIYGALTTELKVLSSNRTATFFDLRSTFNQTTPFVNIKSIALDSEQKIFILDSTLSQIAVYKYKQYSPGERWTLFTTFGGVGGSSAKTKFLNPTNIHIDQYDSLWVVDSGNKVIKHFTNTGSWLFTLRDDEYFREDPPIDICVDSANNLHILTAKVIRVYTYQGEFLFEYFPGEDIIPLTNLRKIATSYNREIVYIATKSQVIRHFRTGGYSGTIINNKQCVDNINDLFHDEYRNLLVANDNKILKFVDTMTLIPLKSQLPSQYWSLKDIMIHDEEYVQNWVYTKSLHRLWDNIEIFRNTLLYNNSGTCKRYKPPIYNKDSVAIGQNEIVTSAVINRALGYLWENFKVILEYYNLDC